ncbi:MAG: hypothetical protein J6Y92_11620 [Lentisphaeria bacterium]|nr:hypothetical protein [Lentisphaeria bacterium]
MTPVFEINKDVVFVQGAKNGAIYSFVSGKVYSVNDIACEIIQQYIHQDTYSNSYLDLLADNGLLCRTFRPRVFDITNTDNSDTDLEVVWLEITHQCNLRCIHCYEGDFHNMEENTLSLEQWKRVVCELVQHHAERIIIIDWRGTMLQL